jgi:hypothetical protein
MAVPDLWRNLAGIRGILFLPEKFQRGDAVDDTGISIYER